MLFHAFIVVMFLFSAFSHWGVAYAWRRVTGRKTPGEAHLVFAAGYASTLMWVLAGGWAYLAFSCLFALLLVAARWVAPSFMQRWSMVNIALLVFFDGNTNAFVDSEEAVGSDWETFDSTIRQELIDHNLS